MSGSSMIQRDSIVVGAGIWGCTLARRLAEAGRKVLVLEKRGRIGGNRACEIDPETGIEIHTYGSHIFHTSNEQVWAFVNRFTKFNDYRHCVLANHAGKIYHLPFGRTLYDEFFGKGKYELPLNAEQNTAVFDAFIKHYTAKQWGMDADKVDPSVIKRLKVRDSYSTDYFDDPHQGIPLDGYNALFERMLDHPNIEVRCNTAFTIEQSTNLNNRTTIMREYPSAWKMGDEPYYPINNPESAALLARYQEEVGKFNHRCTTTTSNYASLVIGGRLGGYKYYDMDKSIAAALEVELG